MVLTFPPISSQFSQETTCTSALWLDRTHTVLLTLTVVSRNTACQAGIHNATHLYMLGRHSLTPFDRNVRYLYRVALNVC